MDKTRAMWLVPFVLFTGAGLVAALLWGSGGTGAEDLEPGAGATPTEDPTAGPTGPSSPTPDEDPGEPEPGETEPGEPPGPEADTGDPFEVVRSLAHDGQRLWVAAATGLWFIDADGQTQPVEGPLMDLYGIAIDADGALVASGVSAEEDGRRPLGVVRSADEGRSWESLALEGEAVLGAFSRADGVWYGYDFARRVLLASDDLRAWEPRWEGPLLDVAVHPDDPDTLVASFPEDDTGIEELRRSDDGGRTWGPMRAPALLLLEWVAADQLLALTVDGAVFSSADVGESWSPVGGSVGTVTAVTEHEGTLYAALRGHGIHRSQDMGGNWERVDAGSEGSG